MAPDRNVDLVEFRPPFPLGSPEVAVPLTADGPRVRAVE